MSADRWFLAEFVASWLSGCGVGLFLAILAHEIGHFLAANICGAPVERFVVGKGRRLVSFRLGETVFEARAFPFFGIVLLFPPLRFVKLRSLVFVLGGIAANIGVGLLLQQVYVRTPDDSPLAIFALTAVLMQFALALVVLVPARVKFEGVEWMSDGSRLVDVLRTRSALTPQGVAYTEFVRTHLNEPDATPRYGAAATRAYRRLMTNGADAHAALVREISRGLLDRRESAIVLDRLVTDLLTGAQAGGSGNLDAWSRRLIEFAPGAPTVAGSRGAALVALGRLDEGERLLRSAEPRATAALDRFMIQIFLAKAEIARGHEAAACANMRRAQDAFTDGGMPANLQALATGVQAEFASKFPKAARQS